MKVNANDFGICGVEQLFCAGTIAFDTEGASDGVVLAELPNNVYITRAVAAVDKAFSAGKITVGVNEAANDVLGENDVTPTTAGNYSKEVFVKGATGAKIKAKLTGTASAGSADIYIFFVSIPE